MKKSEGGGESAPRLAHVAGEFLRSRAGITLAIGTVLAVVLPALLAKLSWGIVFNSTTGAIGDTIGGIAGPVLNLTGLIIVYFSLREQFRANQIQLKSLKKEKRRSRNERAFDLAVKMAEEAGAYFRANRLNFRKVLDESRKIKFSSNPHLFPAEFYKIGVDQPDVTPDKLSDLQLGFAFFSVCQQVAPQLSIVEKRIIANLFGLYYFAPLRSLVREWPGMQRAERKHFQQNYPEYSERFPFSSMDAEIKRQRAFFKEFTAPLRPPRLAEPSAEAAQQ